MKPWENTLKELAFFGAVALLLYNVGLCLIVPARIALCILTLPAGSARIRFDWPRLSEGAFVGLFAVWFLVDSQGQLNGFPYKQLIGGVIAILGICGFVAGAARQPKE